MTAKHARSVAAGFTIALLLGACALAKPGALANTFSRPFAPYSVTYSHGLVWEHGRNIIGHETWDSSHLHVIMRPLQVIADAKLYLQPGTHVYFLKGTRLTAGGSGDGAIIARGRPGKPVVFRSSAASPSPGDWQGIVLAAGQDNVFDHAVIEHAGASGTVALDLRSGATLVMTDSTISHSAGTALKLAIYSDVPTFSSNAFVDNGGYPVAAYPNLVGFLDERSFFARNASNAIRVLSDNRQWTRLTADQRWPLVGIPYIWPDTLEVMQGKQTFPAGTIIRFDRGALIRIQEGGTLIADGTPDRPVVFESSAASPSAGDWQGLKFKQGISAMRHFVVRHTGAPGLYTSAGVAVLQEATLSVSDGTISHGAGWGMLVESVPGVSASIGVMQFDNNRKGDLKIFSFASESEVP